MCIFMDSYNIIPKFCRGTTLNSSLWTAEVISLLSPSRRHSLCTTLNVWVGRLCTHPRPRPWDTSTLPSTFKSSGCFQFFLLNNVYMSMFLHSFAWRKLLEAEVQGRRPCLLKALDRPPREPHRRGTRACGSAAPPQSRTPAAALTSVTQQGGHFLHVLVGYLSRRFLDLPLHTPKSGILLLSFQEWLGTHYPSFQWFFPPEIFSVCSDPTGCILVGNIHCPSLWILADNYLRHWPAVSSVQWLERCYCVVSYTS